MYPFNTLIDPKEHTPARSAFEIYAAVKEEEKWRLIAGYHAQENEIESQPRKKTGWLSNPVRFLLGLLH